MNLGQARALVRKYINEPVAATWEDADLNSLIQEANRAVYLEVCNTSPGWFSNVFGITYPAGQAYVYLWGLIPEGSAIALGETVRILGIYRRQTTGPIGPNNLPSPLKQYLRISDMYHQESEVNTYGNGFVAAAQGVAHGYVTMGSQLFMWPVPQQDLPLALFATPNVATPTADNDGLLIPWALSVGSQLTMHHELVAMLAAIKAKSWVGAPDNGLSTIYANRLKAMKDALAIQQSLQDPAQVRGVGR